MSCEDEEETKGERTAAETRTLRASIPPVALGKDDDDDDDL